MNADDAVPSSRPAVDYDPFAGGDLSRVVPTTEPQREVWLADRLGREASLAFNESISLRLRGPLRPAALRTALQGLFDRHDALRANFGPDGQTLCLQERRELPLRTVDLRALAAPAREAATAARLRAAVELPFALERDLLFRAELLRLGEEEHLLLLTAHHVVCDGWSWWVLVRELGALYAKECGMPAPVLPPAESFADYALALAQRPAQATTADERWWLSQFEGELPVLELPLDRPRPPQRGFASAREDYAIDASLVAALRQLGASRGASLFASLLGGFAVLLSRLAGQDDVVVGIPAAGQAVDGHDRLVGHCVNLLPLRCRLAPGQSFGATLEAMQGTLLDALDHQRCTFGSLLKQLHVPRDPARLPLVSVMFNIDQAMDREAAGFPGLALDVASNPRCCENFELFVNAVQSGGGVRLECQFNRDLFDGATIRRWLAAYETLLRAAVERPDAEAARLPLVSGAARAELAALQPPATAYDRECLMHEHFERQCDRTPERIALRAGATTLRYFELERRANAIAHRLRARGVGRGALVGLAVERGADMVAALLGILKAGAGYVPLDPRFPPARLAHMASDAGLAVLVTERAHVGRFPQVPALLLDAADNNPLAPTTRPSRDRHAAHAEDPAYVIYTSGSTGKPKGVQVPHRAVSNFIAAMQREPGLQPDDRLVAVTTLSFDIAVLELLLPLSVGAEVVVAGPDAAGDGDALSALLAESAATVMQATPATWQLLLDAGWQGAPGFTALCGGEALPPELAARLLRACDEVWNLYGPTETTVWSTCARIAAAPQPPDIHIGRPIANTRVWIVDAGGELCPLGVPGEICIGGEGVALGYLHRPDLTAQRFVSDGFSDWGAGEGTPPEPRLYRTGDRGRWRVDGELEHLGRLDFQVKVRGHRIELGEIENLLAAGEGVGASVAVAREDRPGDVRLVGYVVPRAGAAIDQAALLARLQAELPDYMVPQHLVLLPGLPRLPNGKLDRAALPAPELPTATASASAPPRNDLERCIAAAMAQVLGLARVGIDDDFFALGGHSLLAAQLTSRLNRELDVGLSLRALFDAPTVARLAARIATEATRRERIEPRADQRTAPLSLMQERLCLLEELNPGRTTYHTPSAHRLVGPLDVGAFEHAFRMLMQRHAVLRTSIGREGGKLVQRVHEDVDPGLLPLEDLQGLPEARRESELMLRIQALVAVPFDLGAAPLFRARLFRLDPELHVMFFMPHHMVWDGWSFDLMYQDLAELYAAELGGRASELAPLPVSYGDFAAWHREWVQGPEYASQLAFWRERLGGADPVATRPLALPCDRPRRPGMAGQGSSLRIQVARELTDRLHETARRLDATVFVTLLSAYAVLLAGVTGQHEVVIGTPVRGRHSADVEGLMGFFTNLLPLRLALEPELPFAAAVRRVKAAVLDAFAHPDVRLEDLVSELRLRGDGVAVLYQSLFSFQDIRQRVLQWGNVRHERMQLAHPGATEDLGLWFVEDEFGLSGAMVYNAELLFADTVEGLRQRYLALLDGVARDPATRLRDLPGFAGERRDAPAAARARPSADPSAAGLDPRVGYLVALWSDLLGTPVAPTDNFFDLGGNSLVAVQMSTRVARDFGAPINLMRLASQTLAQLALELPPPTGPASAQPPPGLRARLRRLLRTPGTPGR